MHPLLAATGAEVKSAPALDVIHDNITVDIIDDMGHPSGINLVFLARAIPLVAPLLLVSGVASAEPTAPSPPPEKQEWSRWGDGPRAPAFEVNVLWPIFPGGISELKLLLPFVRADRDTLRGEAIVGVHADFAWRIVREGNYGKVGFLGLKLGYRQFFAYGFHAEASVNVGWREERDNAYDGTTLESFSARLWLMAGWQIDVTRSFYINLRGGVAPHLFRIGDKYADKERFFTGGGDVNFGFRF
jgi:hypothetical protein